MKCVFHTVLLAATLAVAAAFICSPPALGAVGGPSSKHNFTEIPGYGFDQSVCAACHKPHGYSGKRLWSQDKEAPGDGLRDLGPAKAASLDQTAGPDDYAGLYLCLDCHGGSSAEPSWAGRIGSEAVKVTTHSTREMQAAGYSPLYPDFVMLCTDCHDVHQHWDGTFQAGENGYMIRPTVKTPSSGDKTVVFERFSGTKSFSDGDGTHDGICEVCHTQTFYHRNDIVAIQHNGGKDCTQCHLHYGGFAGFRCDDCHGDPPVSADTLVGGASNPGEPATGAATPGKHAFHAMSTAGGAGYPCYACHKGGQGDVKPNDLIIDVNFYAFGISTSGSFDGFTTINGYTFSAGNTMGGTLECRNTYCHGNFAGGSAGNKPVWDDPATGACGTCHATAPPGLANHSVHITAAWGPFAACDDCHPAGSSTGSHASHVDGNVDFSDGETLSTTAVCDTCHGTTAATKPTWGDSSGRGLIAWCSTCHDGASSVNTAAGTGGLSVAAPNVLGDGLTYGFNVTGHGQIGAGLVCADCHEASGAHIDGASPTYAASSGNHKAGYRLAVDNQVPLLVNYTSSAFSLCFTCHKQDKVLGMPAEGRPSALHVHSVPISSDQWYTNFRNVSTTDGLFAGNWDSTSQSGYTHDVPTNIHWNHIDDYGSSVRGAGFAEKLFDSDGDSAGDSYVTCGTCHDPHGTQQPVMVLDDFSLNTHSSAPDPTYIWLGSSLYNTTRCTETCHTSGNAPGTAGTRWYREPTGLSTTTGVPLGLKAEPLP